MSEKSLGRLSPKQASSMQLSLPGSGRLAAWLVGAAALALAACSTDPKDDPNSQASLDKLYAEAKSDLEGGAYDRAIKTLERVEGRAAGTVMAQQAQLDQAWANYKSGERAAGHHGAGPFHQAQPLQPGPGLRALPEGRGQLQ